MAVPLCALTFGGAEKGGSLGARWRTWGPPLAEGTLALPPFVWQHGGHGVSGLPSQWGLDSGALWGAHDKNSSIGLWEESMKGSGPLARSLGLKGSRSSPSLG